MPLKRKPATQGKPKPVGGARDVARLLKALAGPDPNQDDRQFRAQDIVYDAMDAPDPKSRIKLVKEALALDPNNVDALLMLAQASAMSSEAAIPVLRDILALAEKRLGPKAFKQMAPHFWGCVETRPYMRARHELAEALLDSGRQREAAVEYAAMLDLNEGDNQGARYILLPLHLAASDWEAARALMKRYSNDCDLSVAFSWGRVLERWAQGGPDEAREALRRARKQNRHVEAYLTGRAKAPDVIPYSYEMGSEEEALCFIRQLSMAWSAHPEALAWLRSESPARSAS